MFNELIDALSEQHDKLQDFVTEMGKAIDALRRADVAFESMSRPDAMAMKFNGQDGEPFPMHLPRP